jgi:hypothetical protein
MWQGAALSVLLDHAATYDRGPNGRGSWLASGEAMAATQTTVGCTQQAATGAFRALLSVGLADRRETHEGVFWKATEAALRSRLLFSSAFLADLESINERLAAIDQGLDVALKLSALREKLEAQGAS